MDINNFIEMFPKVTMNEKMYLLKMMKEDTSVTKEEKKKFYNKLDSDTSYFAKCFLGHIVTEVPEFHKEIYSNIDSMGEEQQFFAGILFRGAAKSTIKSIFAIKAICHQKHPVIMLISEAEDQALKDLGGITEEFESNELIKYFYFNNGNTKGGTWSKGFIELSNGVAVFGKGMNSKIRGWKHKNQRPTLVIMDDFESRKNLATEEMRKDVFDTVDAVILPMGDVGCKFIFLNTIVSPLSYMQVQYDLYRQGKGLFASPQGKLIRKDFTYFKDNVEYATWESRFPLTEVKRIKQRYLDNNSMDVFYQEYYNIPKEESAPMLNTTMLKEVNGKFHKHKYVKFIEVGNRHIPVNTFLGVDPAVRCGSHNDDTCIFVVGVDQNSNVYILDIYADKIAETDKPLKILDMARKYGVDFGTIETYGYQFSLYEWTQKAMRDMNEFYSFTEYSNGRSKKQKYLEGLEPLINSGKASYLTESNNVDKLKLQMEKFSGGKREHDDLIDGFFLANLNSFPCTCGENMVKYFLDKENADKAMMNKKKSTEDHNNWRTA